MLTFVRIQTSYMISKAFVETQLFRRIRTFENLMLDGSLMKHVFFLDDFWRTSCFSWRIFEGIPILTTRSSETYEFL